MQTNGRDKVVHYWSAEVHDHQLEIAKFMPNAEISQIEWLPIKAAIEKLSYSHDRAIVETLRERIKAGTARTFGVIVLRHAKAVSPDAWDGPDSSRPLLHRGSDQALAIVDGSRRSPPSGSSAAPPHAASPRSRRWRRRSMSPIKQDPGISQEAYEHGDSDVERVVARATRQAPDGGALQPRPGDPRPHRRGGIQRGSTDRPAPAKLRRARHRRLHRAAHLDARRPQLVAVETHKPPT